MTTPQHESWYTSSVAIAALIKWSDLIGPGSWGLAISGTSIMWSMRVEHQYSIT